MSTLLSLVAVGLTLGAVAAWLAPGPSVDGQAAAPSAEALRPRHLRVVWTADPARSAVILWSTDARGTGRLYLDKRPHGTVDGYPDSVACTTARYPGAVGFVHRCPVEALEPSSVYFVVPTVDGVGADERWFVTAPADDRAFRLLFGGDSRSDRTNRRRMNRRLSALLEADEGILALAHGGDYVADGRWWHQWRAWLVDHELTTTRDGRVLPVIPTRGNHEAVGRLFGAVFGLSGQSHHFLTRIGRFRLLTLNTEASLAGEQLKWLGFTLKTEAATARWLTVQYHRAAYPAVKPPSEALMHWVPLFERYDVDLVFESDGHALKRTVPIRSGRRDPSGVTYVGEGGLGVAQRTPDPSRWYLKYGGMALGQHHVQVLSVSPNALEYRAVAIDGRTLDRVRLEPRDRR